MTRQPYNLNHPLYPHPDLLKYYTDHKINYEPPQGSYDGTYFNWYQLVRADHDQGGAPIRPIYNEISQIIRLKANNKEYLLYSETLYGYDHENNQQPFFHTYGQYKKPAFKTVYNYDTKTVNTLTTGSSETVYFIEYNPATIDRLYAAGPDDQSIELLINVGSKQYGGREFYTHEQFRDLPLEELARLGREGKGMFTTATVNVPAGTMTSELRASGTTQTQLWKEFQEFQKFKQQQTVKSSTK